MTYVTPQSEFELGQLHCNRGDFLQAIPLLKTASEGFFAAKDFSGYLKCQNMLLRIYSELEQTNEVTLTKEKLQDLVLKEGFELSSKTYYTLAQCALTKNQNDVALDYLQKALALALQSDVKEDICYAIFGMASVYTRQNPPKLAEALKEIYNLQVFFQVYNLNELKVSTQILNAYVLQKLNKFDEALDICWKAYEDLKETKNLYVYVYLLYMFANLYEQTGEKDLARVYLKMCRKAADPQNYVRLNRMLDQLQDTLGDSTDQTFDLIFDEVNHTVIEKKLGKIDFKNQFILLDLLKLFVQHQGEVYTKEYLVEQVWKQPYDPAIHDNKIYVTIKRLRKLIEPDFEKPKYIFRGKNGYYMNKAARVQLESRH